MRAARRFSKTQLTLAGVAVIVIAAVVSATFLQGAQQPFGANYSACSAGARKLHVTASGSVPLFFVSGRNLSGPVMSTTQLEKVMVVSNPAGAPAAHLTVGAPTVIASGGARANALWTPSVSVSADALAYIQGTGSQVGESGGQGDLVVSKADGADRHVIHPYGKGYSPALSPDGRQVAIVNGGSILVMTIDGRHARGIPAPDGDVRSVAWSPNSACIAASDKNTGRIFIVNVHTGVFAWLTPPGTESFYPAWSPVGNEIAYAAGAAGVVDVANLATGTTRELVTCPQSSCAENWQLAWSPDGSQIAFTRSGNANSTQIFVVPRAGGRPSQITHGPEQHACPTW